MITIRSEFEQQNLTVTAQGCSKVNLTTTQSPTTELNVQQYPNITIVGDNVQDLEQKIGDSDYNFKEEANIYLSF